jgi:Zn-finger nucleic acid-binding protein
MDARGRQRLAAAMERERPTMKCPRCASVELAEATFDKVTVDRCPQCRGLWLDELELDAVLKSRPRGLLSEDRRPAGVAANAAERINCPRCKGTYLIKLNSRHRPGTIVDSCTVCYGTWLDAGELTRLTKRGMFGWIKGLLGSV